MAAAGGACREKGMQSLEGSQIQLPNFLEQSLDLGLRRHAQRSKRVQEGVPPVRVEGTASPPKQAPPAAIRHQGPIGRSYAS